MRKKLYKAKKNWVIGIIFGAAVISLGTAGNAYADTQQTQSINIPSQVVSTENNSNSVKSVNSNATTKISPLKANNSNNADTVSGIDNAQKAAKAMGDNLANKQDNKVNDATYAPEAVNSIDEKAEPITQKYGVHQLNQRLIGSSFKRGDNSYDVDIYPTESTPNSTFGSVFTLNHNAHVRWISGTVKAPVYSFATYGIELDDGIITINNNNQTVNVASVGYLNDYQHPFDTSVKLHISKDGLITNVVEYYNPNLFSIHKHIKTMDDYPFGYVYKYSDVDDPFTDVDDPLTGDAVNDDDVVDASSAIFRIKNSDIYYQYASIKGKTLIHFIKSINNPVKETVLKDKYLVDMTEPLMYFGKSKPLKKITFYSNGDRPKDAVGRKIDVLQGKNKVFIGTREVFASLDEFKGMNQKQALQYVKKLFHEDTTQTNKKDNTTKTHHVNEKEVTYTVIFKSKDGSIKQVKKQFKTKETGKKLKEFLLKQIVDRKEALRKDGFDFDSSFSDQDLEELINNNSFVIYIHHDQNVLSKDATVDPLDDVSKFLTDQYGKKEAEAIIGELFGSNVEAFVSDAHDIYKDSNDSNFDDLDWNDYPTLISDIFNTKKVSFFISAGVDIRNAVKVWTESKSYKTISPKISIEERKKLYHNAAYNQMNNLSKGMSWGKSIEGKLGKKGKLVAFLVPALAAMIWLAFLSKKMIMNYGLKGKMNPSDINNGFNQSIEQKEKKVDPLDSGDAYKDK